MKLFAAILITTFFLPTARAVEPAPARLIGYYSSMQVEGADDPHFVAGYDIVLFQREAETVGHVAVAIGTPEPTGATIKELAYDPKKKLLTFTAEYLSGLINNPIKGAPDREGLQVLTFKGVVLPESISGKVGVRDFYCAQCKPIFKRVKLKRINEMGRTGELQPVPW